MKKIRMGFLGMGPRMRQLMPVYFAHEGVEVVAICDQYRRNLDIAIEKMPYLKDVPQQTDYDTMMRECPMDAIMITINPYLQVQYAVDAMRRGVHVMTEVPCALTVKDCEDLVRAVRQSGCVYQLAEQTRYMQFIGEWRRMNSQGLFGQMLLMEGEYLHYEKWDNYFDAQTGELFYSKNTLEPPSYGKQPVSDVPAEMRKLEMTWRYQCMKHPILYLPHELSPLLSVTDDRIVSVSCMGTREGSYSDPENLPDSRDIEMALMRTAGGTILRVGAGFTTQHGHRKGTDCHWYHVKGSLASAEWSRNTQQPPYLWTKEGGWQPREDWSLLDPNAPDAAKVSGHGGLDWYPINEFVCAIREKREAWMNVDRAVGTALPAILAAQSVEQGGALIKVPTLS